MPRQKGGSGSRPPDPKTTEPQNDEFVICVDSREQHRWHFPSNRECSGSIIKKLDTGDYSVLGLEHIVTIERKGSVAEFAGNLLQPRFEKELRRMKNILIPVVALEFSLAELRDWPKLPGVSQKVQKSVRSTGPYLWSVLKKLANANPWVSFMFWEDDAKELSYRLMKEVFDEYSKNQDQ